MQIYILVTFPVCAVYRRKYKLGNKHTKLRLQFDYNKKMCENS